MNDIFLTRDDSIAVYAQGPGFTFHSKPDIERHFKVRTPKGIENGDGHLLTVVRDLDGDGRADVLVEKEVEEGISSTTATFYLYLGDRVATEPRPIRRWSPTATTCRRTSCSMSMATGTPTSSSLRSSWASWPSSGC